VTDPTTDEFSADERLARAAPTWFAGRVESLERRRWGAPVVATSRRFFAIEGLDLGGLIALELFTTVMPLLLIGYAWLKNFDPAASVGDLFAAQLGATGNTVATIRREFGTAAGLEDVWSPLALTGFLVWGIPMSLTVSRMFALAWRRPQYSIAQRLWRGSVWFAFYLMSASITERILLVSNPMLPRPALYLVAVVAATLFWGVTPVLLVPGVRLTLRQFLASGLVGALIIVVVLRIAVRVVFPMLLAGWEGFGPIGVALTMMTWSGVVGVVWVVVACAGAVYTDHAYQLGAR
jgi:hypothetical protein